MPRLRKGFIGQEGRLKRPRSTIGRLTKRDIAEVEGFDELMRNIRLLSDWTRVEILEGAVEESAEEVQLAMISAAPRDDTPNRRDGHAADRIANLKLWSRRDSRARAVGLSRQGNNWWLKFPELGTIYQAEQPFIQPTGRQMRRRVVQIHVKHMRKALNRAL